MRSTATKVRVRVGVKKTVDLNGVRVNNKTANSILVRGTSNEIDVTDCCLEEPGK